MQIKSVIGGIALVVLSIGALGTGVTVVNGQKEHGRMQEKIESTKKKLKAEEGKKRKVVYQESIYARGKDALELYMTYDAKLHDTNDATERDFFISEMQDLVANRDSVTGSMVNQRIKDWKSEITFGAETNANTLPMGIRFTNAKGQLMMVATVEFSGNTNRLGKFTTAPTTAGLIARQNVENQVK